MMKFTFTLGSGYFASRGKIATCYFAIWRQNSPNGYFVRQNANPINQNAKSQRRGKMLTQSLTLTQTLTLILTLIPTLALTLTQNLTQTEENHYFAFRGKIDTSFSLTR